MKRILVPTDFSNNANNAFPFAVAIADKFNSKIYLLNVQKEPFIKPHQTSRLTVTEQPGDTAKVLIEQDIKAQIRQRLQQLAGKYFHEDIAFGCIVQEGEAEERIVDIAQKYSIEFIVIATMGEESEKENILGSTARNLVRDAHCPVFIVPRLAKFEPFKRMVYVTDLVHSEKDILKEFTGFAGKFGAHITLLHIKENGGSMEDIENQLNEMREGMNYKDVSTKILEDKDVINGLIRFMDTNPVSVIGITTHTKSIYDRIFHKSITGKMVLETHVPLLVYSKKYFDTVLI